MPSDVHELNATEPDGAECAPIPGGHDGVLLLCCSAVPILRRIEHSVAFACRICARMGERARCEFTAGVNWNRDLPAANSQKPDRIVRPGLW